MPPKLALTGAHGTGKTTLIRALANVFDSQESIGVTREVPRLIVAEAGDNSFFKRGNNTFERQLLIVARQLEEEYRVATSDVRLVLCDRTIVDHWAYTRCLFPASIDAIEFKLWEAMVFRWLESYSEILRLAPEFSPVDDGIRESDIEFQMDIDREILSLYRRAGVDVTTVVGSLEDRVTQCSAVATRLLQERT
jgi:nicotinamide riboside kinase